MEQGLGWGQLLPISPMLHPYTDPEAFKESFLGNTEGAEEYLLQASLSTWLFRSKEQS